jgi:hypothetical protein
LSFEEAGFEKKKKKIVPSHIPRPNHAGRKNDFYFLFLEPASSKLNGHLEVAGKLPFTRPKKRAIFLDRYFWLNFWLKFFLHRVDLTHLWFSHILCKYA